ncbi:MAG: GNAT family N-acetyltransferase [Myxococcaceae bacterium]|nr:GNAT family N-acetyltransferase [Myxococcaceae bacterium]
MFRWEEGERVAGALEVGEARDVAAWDGLQGQWNALAHRTGGDIFSRHDFVRLWRDHFAPSARPCVLTARDPLGRLCAVLPLLEGHVRILGVPVRALVSASNAHSCRFDLLADDPMAAAQTFLDHLQARGGWTVLRLADVPLNGQAQAICEVARARGFRVAQVPSLRSPYLPLPANFETLASRLDAKFRANLRRRRRRLAERGEVELEFFTGGPGLDARLEEGFLLEQRGWKGARGTAIAQQPQTRNFYVALAHAAAARGELALLFLRIGGRAAAFHFALIDRRRYLLLKPAYDETLRECSPGQLLMEDALRACIARGLTEFDFLGQDMPWKRDWTDRFRPHVTLYVFADTRAGRALHRARFEWAPRLKRRLTKSSSAGGAR